MNKAQHHSINRLRASIRIIEELVPLEQKRFSAQRKRTLESAHVTLRRHAGSFGITFSDLSLLYHPDQYLEHAHVVAEWLAQRGQEDQRDAREIEKRKEQQ